MHRASSTSRISDNFFLNPSSPSPSSPPASETSKHQQQSSSSLIILSDAGQQLPTYNPLSHVSKKDRYRIRFAENAIHAIPILLFFSAFVLWFFSNPVRREQIP